MPMFTRRALAMPMFTRRTLAMPMFTRMTLAGVCLYQEGPRYWYLFQLSSNGTELGDMGY